MTTSGRDARFAIDANSVAGYREQLKWMAHGMPVAEAAVDGFSDWQVVEAMERIWAIAVGADEDDLRREAQRPSSLPLSSGPT